ncbi:MAG: hypothetical protein KF729_07970 [Sandaracinaceae bacterium]|nr:hypothetical protein [Sandaracinaceae bacterium]
MTSTRALALLSLLALSSAGCDGESPTDGGVARDAGEDRDGGGTLDAGSDAGPPSMDAGERDAGERDAGEDDAGEDDAGADAASSDAGLAGTTFPPRDFRCAAGATPPCATSVPLLDDAARTVELTRDMTPATYTFVISAWAAPAPSFAGAAAGFDLDGLDSGGGAAAGATCEELAADYTSLRDPGHVGVDNALLGLVGLIESLMDPASCPGGVTAGCLDATYAASIARGELLLLVEVSGVDSLTYDEAVDVALYLGAVPGGGAPALGGDGRLAPGQRFDTVATLAAAAPGDVFDGRLRVRFPGTVSLPSVGMLLVPLVLDGLELRANLTTAGLALGVAGATTEVEAIVTQAEALMPGIGATVRSVLHTVSDVAPMAADPQVCDRLSSGYFWDAVPASRS